MRRYAENTEVPVSRSREEMEKLLARYEATAFLYGRDEDSRAVVIGFKMGGRLFRIHLPLPDPDARAIRYTKDNRYRSGKGQATALEQEERRIWRALLLVIKAKLEAVSSGIMTLETAMLSWMVLPDNRTVSEWLGPQLDQAYARGLVPALIPGLPPAKEEP